MVAVGDGTTVGKAEGVGDGVSLAIAVDVGVLEAISAVPVGVKEGEAVSIAVAVSAALVGVEEGEVVSTAVAVSPALVGVMEGDAVALRARRVSVAVGMSVLVLLGVLVPVVVLGGEAVAVG